MSDTAPYALPNGLVVRQHRHYETDFVYREVFVDQVYTRPFTRLTDHPCVVDVGANIGLFSLFIKQQYPAARIYAFEPAPAHFQLLQQNLASASDVHLFELGLGEAPARKTLTYYPDYSLLSGFHGDATTDRQLLGAGIAQQLALDTQDAESGKYVELLLGDKLVRTEKIPCNITTLSHVISQENITCIDLLKIDAEKAELDVLKGIKTDDWKKIRRLVIEAHSTSTGEQVAGLLNRQGYRVRSQKNADFNQAAIYTICAERPE